MKHLVIVRGGGELASGVIHCLYRAGLRVIVLEQEQPGRLTPQIATKPHGGLFFCTNKLFVYCIIK